MPAQRPPDRLVGHLDRSRRACPPWTQSLPVVALLLAACAGTRPSPSGDAGPPDRPVTYGPFTQSYAMVSRGEVVQEISGQPSTSAYVLRYYLTAAVSPTDSLLEARLTIDSVPEASGLALGFDPRQAAAVGGTTFTAGLTPTGRVLELTGGDSSLALVRELRWRLRQLLPRLPARGVEAGAVWNDTLSLTSSASGFPVRFQLVHRHEATAWSDRGGVSALEIRTTSAYTLSGEGTQGGQPFTVDGAGARHAVAHLDRRGRYLGLTAADTARMHAALAGTEISIPITQSRVDTLAIIP